MGNIEVKNIRTGIGVSFDLTIDGRSANFSIQEIGIISKGKLNVFKFITALDAYQLEFITKLRRPTVSNLNLREGAEIARQVHEELERRQKKE